MQEQGCERLLLVPLYPQYAAATTATACDEAFRALMKLRWRPAVRVAPVYFDDPAYIGALAESMRKSLAALDFEPERIIATFHGMPEKYLLWATPIIASARRRRACCATSSAGPASAGSRRSSRASAPILAAAYTDETVGRLAREGSSASPSLRRVLGRCLETLELDRENREIFVHGGGEKFAYLPALNDSEEGVRVIEGVVRRELQGWA